MLVFVRQCLFGPILPTAACAKHQAHQMSQTLHCVCTTVPPFPKRPKTVMLPMPAITWHMEPLLIVAWCHAREQEPTAC